MLCHIGIHRPVTPGEWHLGYCFSHCERCNSAMVKSVLSGWKAPKKLRVVRGKPNAVLNLDRELTRREAALNKSAPLAEKAAEEGPVEAEPAPKDDDPIDPGPPTSGRAKSGGGKKAADTAPSAAALPSAAKAPPKAQVEELTTANATPVVPLSPVEPIVRPSAPASDGGLLAAASQKIAQSVPQYEEGSPFNFSDFDRCRPADGQSATLASDAVRQAQ